MSFQEPLSLSRAPIVAADKASLLAHDDTGWNGLRELQDHLISIKSEENCACHDFRSVFKADAGINRMCKARGWMSGKLYTPSLLRDLHNAKLARFCEHSRALAIGVSQAEVPAVLLLFGHIYSRSGD